MTDTQTPNTLSAAERTLYEHLQYHIRTERGMEDLYDALAATGHPYVTFLADMIGEDEARHHRLFEDWMASIRSMSELDPEGAAIPNVDRQRVRPETISLVERLLEFEKDDLAAVKQLRDDVDDVGDFAMWRVVLDTLVADTKKHIAILKFIRKQLQSAS